MLRTIRLLRWPLLLAYAVAGALALMLATPNGGAILGQSGLTFLPAKILGLPWSAPLFLLDDGPVTALAVVGICYGLNLGVLLMVARGED